MEPRVDARPQRFRGRVERAVFGAVDAVDVLGRPDTEAVSDDGFERSPLALRPGRTRLRRQLVSRALPSWRFGRVPGGLALVLLTGLLAGLLNPAWPGALLAGILSAASPAAQDNTSPVTGPLAAFGDWRIACAGDDDHLYVVTPDGFTTLFGPRLPDLLSTDGSTVARASPDGHRIAYATRASGLAIMTLTGAPTAPSIVRASAAGTDFVWSPDGARIAMTSVTGTLSTVDVATGRVTPISFRVAPAGLAELGGQALVGWRDATHLLIASRVSATNTTRIELVDIQTGLAQPLATLDVNGPGSRFVLSPDGSVLLAYGLASGEQAYGRADGLPSLWLIDCASGSVRSLPGATRALDGPLVGAVWNADDSSLYVATRFSQAAASREAVIHVRILSTEGDYAVLQRFFGIPLEWMPGAGTLVFGQWDRDASGMKSYTHLRTLTYTLRGTFARRLINGAAGRLLYVGFVRTK